VTANGVTLPAAQPFAGAPAIAKTGQSVVYADSAEPGQTGASAIDGDNSTIWHTAWSNVDPDPAPPHEIQIDLGARYDVDSVHYLPRQDGGVNGRIGQYEVYVSDVTTSWGTPVATGTWADSATEKVVTFARKQGRYVRLRALSEVRGNPWTSAAEITTHGTAVPVGPISKTGWKVAGVDSQDPSGPATNAFDNNTGSIWHSQYQGGTDPLPHEIQIDMGFAHSVSGLKYLPRQDGGTNGRIGQYEVYVSDSTSNWGSAVATGTWANDATEKTVSFTAKSGRYLRLRALSDLSGQQFTSAAEITAIGI
jgi:hypothetical protein